ncbi:diguanylate cyclase [Methylophilaceae bacterium]|jgi:catechol-2,3-dioxygenase|nr:diguanylate cyclase [Methylophilaceae bacterium]
MIEGINHYNLRSDESTMSTLKDFYINVVGLSLGKRPPFKSKGFWLNAKGKDVLHLSSTKNNDIKDHHVNSTFDHMAFSASNMPHYEKILTDNNIKYSYREVPEIGTKQLFFKDPVGNGIELIFI